MSKVAETKAGLDCTRFLRSLSNIFFDVDVPRNQAPQLLSFLPYQIGTLNTPCTDLSWEQRNSGSTVLQIQTCKHFPLAF